MKCSSSRYVVDLIATFKSYFGCLKVRSHEPAIPILDAVEARKWHLSTFYKFITPPMVGRMHLSRSHTQIGKHETTNEFSW